MKAFISLFLILAAVANAGTINLQPAGGFGALHQYHDVATSAVPDDPVTMYLPQIVGGTGNASLWFDSEVDQYGNFIYQWRGFYNGSGVPSTLQRGQFVNGVWVGTGEVMTLTITESTRRICTHSGRGQSCHTVWTLLGGEVTTP